MFISRNILVLLFLVSSGHASANNCTKGQPCGNSCISWNKVCRIGNSSTQYVAPTINKSVRTVTPTTTGELDKVGVSLDAGFFEAKTDAAVIYSKPSQKSSKLGAAYSGQLITTSGKIDDWYMITFAGAYGYIHESDLKKFGY